MAKILDALPTTGAAVSRDDLASAVGYAPSSAAFKNPLGALRSLGLVTYPRDGHVAIEPWVSA
jgi:DNA-binding IclR family transcriptional regulator